MIENSEFKEDVFKIFDFDAIKSEKLTVNGLKLVIESILSVNREYEKIDLVTHSSNIELVDSDDSSDTNVILLQFNDVKSQTDEEVIIAETIYSAGREYFEGSYHLEKFAKFCLQHGDRALIKSNISYLNKRHSKSENLVKSYRLLRTQTGYYYLRGITSSNVYKDYNVPFALFVSILSLHLLSKKNRHKFNVSYCEYSESFIRIHFETEKQENVENIGLLKFVLEMTNDEIKRDAFKFSGVFHLKAISAGEEYVLQLKPNPKGIKTPIISVKHSVRPSTMYKQLEGLAEYITNAEADMKEDLIGMSAIKNPDHLRFKLQEAIKKSKHQELRSYQEKMSMALNVKISRMSDLLGLMNKLNQIVPEEFEAKEYLRYLYYDILRGKTPN